MTRIGRSPLHALAEDNLAMASPAMVKTFLDALHSAEASIRNADYGQVSDTRQPPQRLYLHAHGVVRVSPETDCKASVTCHLRTALVRCPTTSAPTARSALRAHQPRLGQRAAIATVHPRRTATTVRTRHHQIARTRRGLDPGS